MRCSNCGADNRASARFCEGCGAPLPLSCLSCGTPNRAGAKFCDSCGQAIAAPSRAAAAASAIEVRVAAESAAPNKIEGERKIVTALFADLKGSTALMEALDPEA